MIKESININATGDFDENIITPKDSQEIAKMIADVVGIDIQKVNQDAAQRLEKCFIELEKMLITTQQENNKNYLTHYYSTAEGWAEYLYSLRNNRTYSELFSICNEILYILRNNDIEHGDTIVVFETDMSKVYFGDESKMKTYERTKMVRDKATGERKPKELLVYHKGDIADKMMKLSKDLMFVKHYNKFFNIAEKIREERKLTEQQINKGHYVEAYQRHLYYQHGMKELSENAILNFKENERLTKKTVAINLYYAMNSEGWWTGGDVGNMQIKGDNLRLATISSIKAVASTLLEIYKDRSNFNVNKFKSLFTQKDFNDMTKDDPEKISKKKAAEIINLLGNKSK